MTTTEGTRSPGQGQPATARPPFRRSALGAALIVALTIAGCSDDTPAYDQRAEAAEQLAVAIAGSDTGIAAVARPSPCVPPSSCPDVAVVELPDRTTLAIESLADIAQELGWRATVVDDRLIAIEDQDDDWSGSISLDSEGRVVVAVGEG